MGNKEMQKNVEYQGKTAWKPQIVNELFPEQKNKK